MYSSGKTHEKPTLASPLPEIANWLAQMYFFRKYPAPVSKGLLDYSEIYKKPCEGINGKFYRKVHGFQNAARCAGLIPVLFALYKKYQGCLKGKIAEELASVDADWIKKIADRGLDAIGRKME